MKSNMKKNKWIFFAGMLFLGGFMVSASMSNAEQRLLYPQEQALKSISNKLSKLIGKFKTYKALHEKGTYTLKPEPGLGILEELDKLYDEFTQNNFPEDNQKVKNVASWFSALKENTPKLETIYMEGYEAYQVEAQKSNIENFPDYNEDVERLKVMYKNYKDPRSVFNNSEKAKKIVPQFGDEYAFFKHLPEKYALLIKAKKAGSLETWIRTNEQYLDGFKAYQDDYAQKLPGMIEDEMDKAVDMANRAKAEKKPLFFKGGVKQQLDRASDLLVTLEAIKGKDDPQVQTLIKIWEKKKVDIDAAEESMAAELLAAVQTPPDVYGGSDKKTLHKMIEKEWQQLYPEDQLVAIRFPNDTWSRSTEWKWNNSGWYKVDTSVMMAKVIVKTSKDIATIYPAYINKDHLKGDKLSVGAHTKTPGYVIEKMLVKNLKL